MNKSNTNNIIPNYIFFDSIRSIQDVKNVLNIPEHDIIPKLVSIEWISKCIEEQNLINISNRYKYIPLAAPHKIKSTTTLAQPTLTSFFSTLGNKNRIIKSNNSEINKTSSNSQHTLELSKSNIKYKVVQDHKILPDSFMIAPDNYHEITSYANIASFDIDLTLVHVKSRTKAGKRKDLQLMVMIGNLLIKRYLCKYKNYIN